MAGLLGSGARVRVAAWGCAGCRYCGVTALATLSQAVEAVHARSALARCLVPGRSCSPASNAGSLAPSVSWSAYRAKVPGQDVLRTAIRGRGHVLRSRPRAAALRRARPPRRREGLFLCVFAWERVFSSSVDLTPVSTPCFCLACLWIPVSVTCVSVCVSGCSIFDLHLGQEHR